MKSKAELAAEQAAFWNGPGGQGWLATYHKRIERSIADLGQDALAAAAAQPREHVIDIGCGMGGTTADLARAFADAGPQAVEKARAAIAEALAPHQGPDGVMLPGACWLVSAGKG